jgi:hypothetical protein
MISPQVSAAAEANLKREVSAMLEKLPAGVGHALRGVRAGFDRIVGEQPTFTELKGLLLATSARSPI